MPSEIQGVDIGGTKLYPMIKNSDGSISYNGVKYTQGGGQVTGANMYGASVSPIGNSNELKTNSSDISKDYAGKNVCILIFDYTQGIWWLLNLFKLETTKGIKAQNCDNYITVIVDGDEVDFLSSSFSGLKSDDDVYVSILRF